MSYWLRRSLRPPKQYRLLLLLLKASQNYRRTLLLKTPHTSVGRHGDVRVGVELGAPALLVGFPNVEKQSVGR